MSGTEPVRGAPRPLVDAHTGEIFLTPTIGPRFTFSQFVQARAGKEVPAELRGQDWHSCWLRQDWEDGWRVSANLVFHGERLDRVRLTFDDLPADAGWEGRTRGYEAYARRYQEGLLARDLAGSSRPPLWRHLIAGSPLERSLTPPEYEYRFSWGMAASRFDGRDGCYFIRVQYRALRGSQFY